MRIKIFRGQNQIGGSIIQIASDRTKLILDIGLELDERENVEVPAIEGLFTGEADVDAVLVSHYHADHVGLYPHILNDIPVYMGETAYSMLQASCRYRNKAVSFLPKYYHDKRSFDIGDIRITPFRCDHSAYDSYMLLMEHGGKRILYTGDYRGNGRADYLSFLEQLPEVDVLITEGTTLSREGDVTNIAEERLEEIAVSYLKRHKGPVFFMMSAMNIDRLTTAYNVAKRTGKTFLEDIYTAEIASASGNALVAPAKKAGVRVFISRGGDSEYKKLLRYEESKTGKRQIAGTPFVMCVRPSMKNYLMKLNELMSFEDGVLFYAMWKGYMGNPQTRDFMKFMESLGVKVHILHTSGHADKKTIEKLIAAVRPKSILPLHTENAKWFDKYSAQSNIIYASEFEV